MEQVRRRRGWLPLLLGALLFSVSVSGGMVSAQIAEVPLRQGVSPTVLNGAAVFGTTPADTPVTVSIILRMRQAERLKDFIHRLYTLPVQDRTYLTTDEFANTYGQDPAIIQAIRSYLGQFGIETRVAADHLDIMANGTAGAFDAAFSVRLQDMEYDGRRFHGTKAPPMMPENLADAVLAVLGLTNYGNFVDHLVPALKSLRGTSLAKPGASVPVGLAPADFALRYNVTPLYQAGDEGQGQSVGIVTLAATVPADAFSFWSTVGASTDPGRLQIVPVDGGAGAPSLNAGSLESSLDVEQAGAVAPQANVVVYEAPNTDYGFADAFYQAVSTDQVASLSTSWGYSEDLIQAAIASGSEAPAYAAVFNQVFQEAAAQGITVFVASGDGGAYQAYQDYGTTDLSVDFPADSPYVTATGATTLPGVQDYGSFSLSIPKERTWGWDYLWPYWQALGFPDEATAAENLPYGSGGGYSAIFPEPSYQRALLAHAYAAVPYLTPINRNSAWSFDPTPAVVHGQRSGRALPDLVANGDPETGYGVYSSLLQPVLGTPWIVAGGTSFVAPQMAAVIALIDQAVGRPVGFLNPQIYRFALSSESPFTPLDDQGTINDNLYYTGQPGALYNPGSGLGVPDVAKLALAFQGGNPGGNGAQSEETGRH